jgi:transposase-like protein
VGHPGELRHGVQPQQEDLRPDRGLNQPIDGEQPYVYLDGIVLKRTWAGEVRNVSLLVAISVNADGYRQILGIVEGAKEDKAGWSGFLAHLKGRGLRGVELIVSDACMGLVESAAELFPEARWQRCMVHFYRNVFSHVPAGKLREVALMLKAIHAQEDLAAAQRKAAEVTARLHSMRLGKAAELVETAVPETLAYYAFPEEHWRRIRTNNPLERIMREIRRRTRVVGAFPDGNSALNLAAARLRHIAGTRWSSARAEYRNVALRSGGLPLAVERYSGRNRRAVTRTSAADAAVGAHRARRGAAAIPAARGFRRRGRGSIRASRSGRPRATGHRHAR